MADIRRVHLIAKPPTVGVFFGCLTLKLLFRLYVEFLKPPTVGGFSGYLGGTSAGADRQIGRRRPIWQSFVYGHESNDWLVARHG